MTGAPDFLPGPVVYFDDRFLTTAVPSGGAETTVLTFRTQVGRRPFVVTLATHTSGSASSIVWSLKSDGSKMFPYSEFSVSPSDPSLWRFLPYPVEVPQNAEISVTAKNSGGASADCTARVMVFYTDL